LINNRSQKYSLAPPAFATYIERRMLKVSFPCLRGKDDGWEHRGERAGVKGNGFACFILKTRSSFVPLTATTAVSGGMSIVASSLAAATAALSATLEFDFRRPLATPGGTPRRRKIKSFKQRCAARAPSWRTHHGH
jgi:hypothetical protein